MTFDNLDVERGKAIALVTIKRPKVLNALDSHTPDELGRAALQLQREDELRVVILTAARDVLTS